VNYHRILVLPPGVYTLGTLAVALQVQLKAASNILDGDWSVSSNNGQLHLNQSSPTASAVIYSRAIISGLQTVSINWTFTTGTIAESRDWGTIWAAANVTTGLPSRPRDACGLLGIIQDKLSFSPAVPDQYTQHIDLARHKTLHLCSRELPQTSLTAHGRCDVHKVARVCLVRPRFNRA